VARLCPVDRRPQFGAWQGLAALVKDKANLHALQFFPVDGTEKDVADPNQDLAPTCSLDGDQKGRKVGGEKPLKKTPGAAPSPEPVGLKRWLLSLSLIAEDANKPFAGGILWMNWQRRGDFQALLRETGLSNSSKVAQLGWRQLSDESLPLHERFLDAFFETPWLGFDAFVGKLVDGKNDRASFQKRAQKCMNDFAANQIEERLRAEPEQPQPFRVWLDAQSMGYENRKAALDAVESNVFRSVLGFHRAEDKVINHRTASTVSLQVCGLLLRAVLAAWRNEAQVPARKRFSDRLADRLGWGDLKSASRPGETKFSVYPGLPKFRPELPVRSVPAQLSLFDGARQSTRTRPR